jgi:diguanylate cyclase (GGDEF)-like protein
MRRLHYPSNYEFSLNMIIFSIACYLIALIIQLASALISTFLFKHLNKYQSGWAFLSIALFIMIYRRLTPLNLILESQKVVISDAIASLIISIFIFLGVIGLKDIVLDLEKKNNQLKNEAKIDLLTGAYGREEAYLRGKSDISRSLRNKKPIGFIMIDLDYFKKVNDQYGHLAGNVILKKLSSLCKNEIRNVDTFSRFGGEEFLVILPNIDDLFLNEVAERLRRKIEKFNFNYLHKKIHVNISAGVSYYNPNKDRSTNPNSIFLKYVKRADDAMYIAKDKGRNRVEQWT